MLQEALWGQYFDLFVIGFVSLLMGCIDAYVVFIQEGNMSPAKGCSEIDPMRLLESHRVGHKYI